MRSDVMRTDEPLTNTIIIRTRYACIWIDDGIIICGSKKKNQTQIIGNDMNYGSWLYTTCDYNADSDSIISKHDESIAI